MKQCRSILLIGLVIFSCHKEQTPAKITGVPRPESTPVAVESQPTTPPKSEPVVAVVEPTMPEPVKTEPATLPAEQPSNVSSEARPMPEPPKPKPIDAYDNLLKANVSAGKVDYSGIKKERATLDEFLDFVAKASSTQKLAFWINAYNATVIAALLDNGLPKQVTDVAGFFDSKKYNIAGTKMTLNDLEGKIRKEYKDPRVHFALNCGAKSCPPLLAKAFRDSSLDKTLTDLASKFLNGSGVKLDETKKELQVTKLFDWYGTDFKEKEGSVEAYLKKWVTESSKKTALDAGDYKIKFQDYDWALNKK